MAIAILRLLGTCWTAYKNLKSRTQLEWVLHNMGIFQPVLSANYRHDINIQHLRCSHCRHEQPCHVFYNQCREFFIRAQFCINTGEIRALFQQKYERNTGEICNFQEKYERFYRFRKLVSCGGRTSDCSDRQSCSGKLMAGTSGRLYLTQHSR